MLPLDALSSFTTESIVRKMKLLCSGEVNDKATCACCSHLADIYHPDLPAILVLSHCHSFQREMGTWCHQSQTQTSSSATVALNVHYRSGWRLQRGAYFCPPGKYLKLAAIPHNTPSSSFCWNLKLLGLGTFALPRGLESHRRAKNYLSGLSYVIYHINIHIVFDIMDSKP